MAQKIDSVMIQKGYNGYRVEELYGRRVFKTKDYKSFSGAYNAWMKAPKSKRDYFSGSNWTPDELKKLRKNGSEF